MPLWPQFIGPAYTMRSQNIDDEAAINIYLETVESNPNAKKSTFYGTPGLINVGLVTDASCRGMFAQDGKQYAVIGSTFYEMTIAGSGPSLMVTVTVRGTGLANDGRPVFMASNGDGGNQIAISSGGSLYIWNFNTNTFSGPITLPLTNAAGPVVFINSYFLLIEVNSLKVWFSEFEDGTTWNGLDFFANSNTSDRVVGMAVVHDNVRVFYSKTNMLWYDAGEADNPFLPYPGSVNEAGAVNATAIAKLGENIVWLSRNQWNVVQMMQVGTGDARVISTPAIEFALASYTTVADAEIAVYEQEQHQHAVWTFPTADASWALDLREDRPNWHQRSSTLAGDPTTPPFTIHRWRVRGICAPGAQVILCGDYVTGNIYVLSLDTFTENCVAMLRLRRWPYPSAENQWLFIDQVELGNQGGVGKASGVGVNANVNLRISRDSGNTYAPTLTASMGLQNVFNQRTIWRKLGRVRADRLVGEVSMTDPVRCVWGPGLWLRTQDGSGQL